MCVCALGKGGGPVSKHYIIDIGKRVLNSLLETVDHPMNKMHGTCLTMVHESNVTTS